MIRLTSMIGFARLKGTMSEAELHVIKARLQVAF